MNWIFLPDGFESQALVKCERRMIVILRIDCEFAKSLPGAFSQKIIYKCTPDTLSLFGGSDSQSGQMTAKRVMSADLVAHDSFF